MTSTPGGNGILVNDQGTPLGDDSINAMIDEVRGKVFPILDNAGRATQALAEIMDRINRGEGNVGRLLVDQTLMQQAEATR